MAPSGMHSSPLRCLRSLFFALAFMIRTRPASALHCEWHLLHRFFRARINYTDDPWKFEVDKSCTSLSYTTWLWGPLDDGGAAALASALKELPQLEELKLGWNSIADNGASQLAQALKHLPQLRSLSLPWNNIGDIGARALGDALETLTKLEDLDMFWNSFTSVGVEALAKGLKKTTALKRLNLAWNSIGNAGAAAVARALPQLPQLEEVSLAWGGIGNDGIEAIAIEFPRLLSLRELRVKNNDFDTHGAATLAGAVANTEVFRGGEYLNVNGLPSSVLDAARKANSMHARSSKLAITSVGSGDEDEDKVAREEEKHKMEAEIEELRGEVDKMQAQLESAARREHKLIEEIDALKTEVEKGRGQCAKDNADVVVTPVDAGPIQATAPVDAKTPDKATSKSSSSSTEEDESNRVQKEPEEADRRPQAVSAGEPRVKQDTGKKKR